MFASKLHRPQLSSDIIPRQRVTSLLEENRHKDCILVTAPAGFGKSIAISQWLENYPKRHIWISLDESMDDLRDFMMYLSGALKGILPKDNEINLLVKGDSGNLNSAIAGELLENELYSLNERLVVVLDDVHVIRNTAVLQVINHIIHASIKSIQIVLVSRHAHMISVDNLELYGKLFQIRANDLLFDRDEFESLLLRSEYSHALVSNKDEIFKFSEGWILGIRMIFAMNPIDHSLPDLLFQTDKITSVVEQLIKAFPDQFTRTLYIMSLCESFNADLADYMIRFYDIKDYSGNKFLDDLLAHNFFVVGLDHEKHWYRFHHFFRELLHAKLLADHPDLAGKALEAISKWFEKQQFIDDSIKYAAKSENFELAVSLIVKYRFDVLDSDEWWRIQKWLDWIPSKIKKSSIDLQLSQLWILEDTMQLDYFESYLDLIRSQLKSSSTNAQKAEFLFHEAWFRIFINTDASAAHQLLVKSKNLYDGSKMFYARREHYMAISAQMMGNPDKALQELDQIGEKYDPYDLVALRMRISKLFVLLPEARFEDADKESRNFVFAASGVGYQALEAYSGYMRGNVAFQQMKLTTAIQSLNHAVSFQQKLNFRVFVDACCGLALCHSLIGNTAKGLDIINDLQERGERLGWHWFMKLIEGVKFRLYWHMQNTEGLMDWAQSDWEIPKLSDTIFAMDHPMFNKLRIIMTHGSSEQVESGFRILTQIEELMISTNNSYHLVDFTLLKAVGMNALGDHKSANALVAEAVQIGNTQSIHRPFIEVALAIPEIKKMLLSHAISENVRMGLTLSKGQPSSSVKREDDYSLSRREKEVIHLVRRGLQNKEVADKLNISEVTVKSHLTRIFKKMGVKNRVQMIKKNV